MVKKIETKPTRRLTRLEKLSFKVIRWVGTPKSIIIHTLIFIGIPALSLFGFDFRAVTLLLTTWLSMEAIYLAIFIQMTVNRQSQSIEDIQEDVEDIQEDVEDLSEDVEDITEDIDKLQEQEEEESSQGRLRQLVKKGISELRSRHIL